MASFLSTLGASARAAYSHVVSGIAKGLSANRIGAALKAAGVGIRRQTLLDMVRVVRGIEATRPQLRNLKLSARPNVSRLPAAAHETLRDYSFVVKVQGVDRWGNFTDRFITISTNNGALTRGQLEDAAMTVAGGSSDSGGLVPESAQLQTGMRSPSLLF